MEKSIPKDVKDLQSCIEAYRCLEKDIITVNVSHISTASPEWSHIIANMSFFKKLYDKCVNGNPKEQEAAEQELKIILGETQQDDRPTL